LWEWEGLGRRRRNVAQKNKLLFFSAIGAVLVQEEKKHTLPKYEISLRFSIYAKNQLANAQPAFLDESSFCDQGTPGCEVKGQSTPHSSFPGVRWVYWPKVGENLGSHMLFRGL